MARPFREREISEISCSRSRELRPPLHELQVVDDDETQFAVRLEAAGLGPDVQDGGGRGIVDIDGAIQENPGGFLKLGPAPDR